MSRDNVKTTKFSLRLKHLTGTARSCADSPSSTPEHAGDSACVQPLWPACRLAALGPRTGESALFPEWVTFQGFTSQLHPWTCLRAVPAGVVPRFPRQAWRCLEKENTWPVAHPPAPPWCGRPCPCGCLGSARPAKPRLHRSGLCSRLALNPHAVQCQAVLGRD